MSARDPATAARGAGVGADLDELFREEESLPPDIRAIDVMRAGLRRTPGIKRVIGAGALLALAEATGRLTIPILVQQVLDHGLLGPQGYRAGLVNRAGVVAIAVIVVVGLLAVVAERMMARGAQRSLFELRRQAFAHIHKLSLVAHAEERRGALLARVTSDIEAVTRFIEWGAITWARNMVLILGAFVAMFFYSWQLALVTVACLSTVIPVLRLLQRRQLRAYDKVRTEVGNLLGVFNEVLVGAAAVRSYGYRDAAAARIDRAVDARYRANIDASRFQAVLFTVGDFVGAVTVVVVALLAMSFGADWGLEVGEFVTFFLLISLIQGPLGELTEVLDDAQTAVAGWNKVLTLLQTEPDIVEPHPGSTLPAGPLGIRLDHVSAAYGSRVVLHDVNVAIPPGTSVAVVGETGSGKTTFARLLCRLLDPVGGTVTLGGVDLRDVSPEARRARVRLVPQDGFLFDTTVADNVRFGGRGITRGDVEHVVTELGLHRWIARLPDDLETRVGPRGDQLSVGERQLVALLRAQVADPGLLVLDEATSSLDPETEQALALALARLASGRTVVSVAHRISTAERADLVLVFDKGRLVEQGHHTELVDAGGIYARLHRSWQRTVGADR